MPSFHDSFLELAMRRIVLVFVVIAAACASPEQHSDRGKEVITRYGCQTCHVIPGIEGGGGILGPSLENYRTRTKIADKLPLTPETLARYIENPPAVDPDSRMPPVGLTADEARDAATYLLR